MSFLGCIEQARLAVVESNTLRVVQRSRAAAASRLDPHPRRPCTSTSHPPTQKARVAIIEETIRKEQRIQREHLEAGVAAGRIAAYAPPPLPARLSVRDAVGLPEYAWSVRRRRLGEEQQQQQQQLALTQTAGGSGGGGGEPAATTTAAATASALGPAAEATRAAEELTRHLWGAANPGFVDRDGARLVSATRADYAWDAEAVAFMRAAGEFSQAHHRRRDEFVDYVEKAIRTGHRLGRRDGAGGVGAGGKSGK